MQFKVVQFEFSLTWSDAIHNFKWVKIIQIWQNGGQQFSNLTDWCYVLF